MMWSSLRHTGRYRSVSKAASSSADGPAAPGLAARQASIVGVAGRPIGSDKVVVTPVTSSSSSSLETSDTAVRVRPSGLPTLSRIRCRLDWGGSASKLPVAESNGDQLTDRHLKLLGEVVDPLRLLGIDVEGLEPAFFDALAALRAPNGRARPDRSTGCWVWCPTSRS